MKITKNVLITGAGSGIGHGLALRLSSLGYHVTMHYNSSGEEAAKTLEVIKQNGGAGELAQADLSKKSDIDRLFAEYTAKHDRLDLFVNNSGVTKMNHILEMTEEVYDTVADLNMKGAYFCIQGAAKIMANQHSGNIVSIASNHAFTLFANASVYGSMKTALVKFTKHAAIELAQYGIRVNTIAPGYTNSYNFTEERMSRVYDQIPLKRWVTSEEIADTIAFLDSPAAASITGTAVIMDGGAHLMFENPHRYGL
jgi:NAD(P)-dependent dehydrogenase (short-subunit alcohol dehydrogenase family)